VAYHKPQYPDPDDAPISVMLKLLAGSRIAPLYTKLVRDQKLAAGVTYYEAPGRMYPNLMVFSLTPRAPHTNQELLQSFDKIVAEFKVAALQPEEIEIAKRALLADYIEQLSSNRSLALDLATAELIWGDWRSVLDWYDQILAVKAEDIARVAEKYLRNETRTIAFLERGNEKDN
jgi:zinc protease